MPLTLRNKLESYSDALHGQTDNVLQFYIEQGCSLVFAKLPKELLYLVSTEQSVPNDTTGLVITGKLSEVVRNSLECRRIDAKARFKASSSTSIYQATSSDPVYYLRNGRVYVLPIPTVGEPATVDMASVPTIADINGDNALTGVAEHIEPIIMMYSASMVLAKTGRTMQSESLDKITAVKTNLTAVLTAINDAGFTFTQIDASTELVLGTRASSSGAVSMPTAYSNANSQPTAITDPGKVLDAGETSITDSIKTGGATLDFTAFNAILDEASNFIGSLTSTGSLTGTITDNAGAFWLDDEDPEMVNSAVQLTNASLSHAQAELNKLIAGAQQGLPKLTERLKEYQADVQAVIGILQANIQRFQMQDKVIENTVMVNLQRYSTMLQQYGIDVNEYQSFTTATIQRFQNMVQQQVQAFGAKIQEENLKLQQAQIDLTTVQVASYQEKTQLAMQDSQRLYQLADKNLTEFIQSQVQNVPMEAIDGNG